MHFLGKFKLLWFLSLCLLTQAHNIHRREVESDRDLEALRTPQKFIIQPIQTLTKLTDNSVAPPYDAVDFGVEDKLNEIECKNEDSNYELLKELEFKTSEANNDKSTQTEEEFEIAIEATQETLDEANLIQTKNEKNSENLIKSESNDGNKDEMHKKTKNQQVHNDFIKVETNMDSENVENNFKYLKTLSLTNFEDEQKHQTAMNGQKDKETNTTNFDKAIATETMNSEKITPTKLDKEKEPINPTKADKAKETLNSEKITPTKLDKEKETINTDQIISTKQKEIVNTESIISSNVDNFENTENKTMDSEKINPTNMDNSKHTANESTTENNLKDKKEETLLSENTEDNEKKLMITEKVIPTKENNDKEQIAEQITFTEVTNSKDKVKETTIEQDNLNDKIKEPINSENIKESTDSESSTTGAIATTTDSVKATDNLNKNSLENVDKNPNLVIVSDVKIVLGNSEKVNENILEISETTNKISTTEKITTETSINSNKDSKKQQNIKVTTETAVTDLKETKNKPTVNEKVQQTIISVLATQTTTETMTESSTSTTTEKLPKNPNTATQSKPVKIEEIGSTSASPTATTTTSIKPLTESPLDSTTKPSVSFITPKPTRPSRLPTRRPILPVRRPTTTRRPITNPGWFSNFPILPNAPLVPTFFINPFNTTSSTTNQTQSTFGFGIFAVPWNWRPNFTNFFGPNRIIETRPPLNDAPTTPPAESRDLAFWNALFHRGYTNDPGANKQTNAKVNKTQPADGTPSYWKPWTYITGSEFLKFPKLSYNKNGSTEQATIPANTQVLHLYFPLKYPFQGQIVQSPAKKLKAEVITTAVADKIDLVAKARKSDIDVKETVKASAKETDIDVKESVKSSVEETSTSEIVKETATELSSLPAKTKSDDIEGVNKVMNEKASLMFELELPKPVINFVKGVMDTFRPQKN